MPEALPSRVREKGRRRRRRRGSAWDRRGRALADPARGPAGACPRLRRAPALPGGERRALAVAHGHPELRRVRGLSRQDRCRARDHQLPALAGKGNARRVRGRQPRGRALRREARGPVRRGLRRQPAVRRRGAQGSRVLPQAARLRVGGRAVQLHGPLRVHDQGVRAPGEGGRETRYGSRCPHRARRDRLHRRQVPGGDARLPPLRRREGVRAHFQEDRPRGEAPELLHGHLGLRPRPHGHPRSTR